MKKTTRKSFSRKAIIIIASVFLVISLTATGFAAWLISNNADGKGEGNVTASNVSDAILGVTIDNSENLGTINFGPEKGDNEGNVKAENADDVESLTVTVTGKIGNFNTLDKMLVTVNCPDEVLTAAGYTWTTGGDGARTYVYNKDKAFIALPAYAMDKDGKKLPLPAGGETKAATYESANGLFTAGDNGNEKKFSVEVKFGWGELFEGYNPGRYLDEETVSEKKLTVSAENKKALLAIANEGKEEGNKYDTLNAFAKRDILNYMKTLFGSSTLKYTVVINAQAK